MVKDTNSMSAIRVSIPRRVLSALVLCVVAPAACRSRPASSTESPSIVTGRPVVLVTIDTLRADRLGSYGSTRGLTPALDRFAQSAVRFTAAVTQVPITLPAHATMLTGLHPSSHGVRTNDGFKLAAGVPIISEALRSRGYATGAFIGGFPLQAASGLARGFDRYDDEFLRHSSAVERSADAVVDSALGWITERRAQPFFAWLHLFDPHSPYTPPPPFATAHPGAPYDGEIAYTDAALGRFFDRLRELRLFARSTVMVVADHGESLGEHGERTHGTFLYDATIRVPLLIKLADQTSARTIDVPVETADLAPTLAEISGASFNAVDGHSLMHLLNGAAGDPDRPAYAESYYQNVLMGWSPLRAVRTGRWKFIEAPAPELYDLESDPGERENRIDDRLALAAGLKNALPRSATAIKTNAAPAATEAAERLRSLGYVSGSTIATAASRAVDPKDRIEVWSAIEDGIDEITRNPAAARQALARALSLDPGNGLATKYLADISFRAGHVKEAREGYRHAIALGFRHPDAYVNLASIAERDGRFDEARAALNQAVQLAAGDADAWNRLGLLETRLDDVGAARAAFTSALTAAPDRAEPYYNLAIVERRSGNEAAAMSRLQEAVKCNPSYPEAHYELGTGYLAAKQPERALEEYRAALFARSDYTEALFGAARAALDSGQKEEARRDYQRFIAVAPKEYSRQIAAAREALRRLR
jgi:arylsulfatase A-like enzyme/Tfp pilus assembly protein PilF